MAHVDALFLHRSDPTSGVLVFNTNDPAQNLNANDFNFGTQAGFDVSLTRVLENGNAVELRYFGVNNWDGRLDVATTRNDLLQFNAAVPVTAAAGDAVTASYASRLHNAEVNLSHQFRDWLALAVGFRYLELSEQGGSSLVNAAIPADYGVTTENHLYGAQIGAQSLLWCHECFQLDAIGKVGIYGNDADHNALITTGVATVNAGGSDDSTAFVGELGIQGAALLTANLSVRGGYRLLWVDGVALASDQLAATDFFTSSGIDGSGDVFYQGAYVGLELTR
jgi:hypothetical protein